MIGVNLNVLGMDAMVASLGADAVRTRAEGAMLAIVEDASDAIMSSEDAPVGVFSHLANAWANNRGVEWDGGALTGFIDPTPMAPYAWYVIHGVKAGGKMPPIAPIQQWVEKKLGIMGREARSRAFLIARRQKTHGRAPNDFVTPIAEDNRALWMKRFKEALRGDA